jgi:predicted nucleotidyltransferase
MNFDWNQYKGNLSWLSDRTIYVTRHGSHAYGTSLPTSDVDIRGICIAPKPYYLGFAHTFEQADQKEPDLCIFEIRKFLRLACDANPNVLELLYTVPEDHLLMTPLAQRLIDHRSLFLSRKAKHTFSGYAVSQLKRINTHYRWLKNPPTGAPTRGDFGLPERTVIPADQLAAANAAIKKRLDEWSWHELEDLAPPMRQAIQDEFYRRLTEITQWSGDQLDSKVWQSAANSLGFSTNFIEVLDKERQYTSRLREWQQYNEWKKTRNPARAELEEKFGYDTKHGMHLVRLLVMCREILEEGVVRVRRADAEKLLQIRAGAWDYFELVSWAEKQDKELEELVKTSSLPKQPHREKIDELCMAMVEASFLATWRGDEQP